MLYGLGRIIGRTRILTDTPEKLKIDEDYIRREEKARLKEEIEMKNLTQRNVLKQTTKKSVKSVKPQKGCRGDPVKTVYCQDIFGGNN